MCSKRGNKSMCGTTKKGESVCMNKARRITLYISALLFVMVSSFLVHLTLAKYKETLTMGDTARTAKYIFNVITEQNAIMDFVPKTSRNFSFYISNFKGEISNPTQKNEVKLKYYIRIEELASNKLPLKYKLYSVDNGIENEIPLNDGKSDWIDLAEQCELQEYRLEVEWYQDKGEYIYQNITDNIKLCLEVEQIDG